ncbi:hypothetical protein A3B32_00995 [Candidatus Uhrbacteria bacterium RIFCSPLOWO2_01_FULL_53_9]|uniref:Uncharacterized protein n=3 Tax=Candidatus Uhriibacteriota TaxID=1752732 RepID=A0A1F7UYZ4_9BACT|nr:MAG: hypothetical protein A3C17_00860 [Candidatus Uhrbacteria bacterium RIFCSPHIGHO2_02_FULL_53_13]OGL82937.1 MAG: hypothetical protein A3B32_00995 [Candidatus Uhrbacteria bacterium RIFCSPLOWO2_01_FULL_53_9]OGL89337.1 MAG: hypothetical protein A3I45_02775 [Candidatus Uhrbacteria bacterium RIFCSPLOWO2_02_FULL_53_10]
MTASEYILLAVVLVIVLSVIAWGVLRTTSTMSETDKIVRGCWSGKEPNRANELKEVGLLLWSGGNYTIVSDGFNAPIIERGKYATSAGNNGLVILGLEPDKLGRDIAQYPQFGSSRSLSVTAETLNGVRTLRFDGGTPYVNTSCEPYAPQV